MKTRILFISVLIFFPILCFSQEEIKIDFDSKKIINLSEFNNFSEGKFYKIKIENINPNRYNVVINSKDTVVNGKLNMPTFADISLDALTKLTNDFSISTELMGFLKKENDGGINIKTKNSLVYLTTINISNPIKDKIDAFSKDSRILKELLSENKDNYDKKKMDFYKFKISKFRIKNESSDYDISRAILEFEDIRNAVFLLSKKVNEKETEFNEFINSKELKDYLKDAKNENDKANIAKIVTFYSEINVKLNEFKEAVSAENVEKLLSSIIFLSNENSFTSLPIQFTKEQAKVTLKFVPKNDEIKKYIQEETMTFYFPLPLKNYWSVGTTFYYASNMKNERFSTIGTTDSNDVTTYVIKEEESIDEELGVGLMLRYGWKDKYTKSLGYHFSFGPGVSIEKDIKPRLLLGGGLSLGNKHALTIDAGIMAGYVNRKSSIVNVNQIYSERPTNLTVTKLDFSPFISLGYLYKL